MLHCSRPTRSRLVAFLFVLISTPALAASDFLSLGILWTARLDTAPATQPVADAHHLYLPLRNGQLRALSLADGRQVWSIEVPFTTGLAESDGLIAGATDKELVVIDGATGRTHWSVPLPEIVVAPSLRAGWVLAASGPELLAFRMLDGSLVWRLDLGAPLRAPATIEGERVFASLTDGTVVAAEITAGTIVWRKRLPAPAEESTAVGDRLYLGAGDKFFYALDARDGDRDWRWRAAAAILSPAAFDESRVYYTALDNVVRAVDAGSGVQKWRYPLDTRPLAGPVLDDDLLIVTTASDLRAVRAADGSLAGRIAAPAELVGPSLILSRVGESFGTRAVLVTGAATGDWRVYGFAPSPEPPPQPLKETPGRPLSPDVLPAPREPPSPAS